MTTPLFIIYDDGQGRFGPMTGLRTVFEVRRSVRTNLNRIEALIGRPAGDY